VPAALNVDVINEAPYLNSHNILPVNPISTLSSASSSSFISEKNQYTV